MYLETHILKITLNLKVFERSLLSTASVLFSIHLRYGYRHAYSVLLSLCVGIWEKMATSGSRPPKLSGHTFTKIDRSKVVLFGGQTEGKCISDVYILSLDSWVGLIIAYTIEPGLILLTCPLEVGGMMVQT